MNPDGYLESWNAGAENIKGYSEDNIVGEHISTFYTEEEREANVPQRNLRAACELGEIEESVFEELGTTIGNA